ncbi:protein-tyrosine phosphatase [Salmonella enterica subsp. enterica]|uniref:Protein-tyrosine phosphatase n=1 Tax=Salmonella enterica I TaxID=59201 RepID=A0A379WQQ5_SALET|nr:protein-tyrosine phosphatase [Salmonella enterica subsp. enterica]
MLNKILVVCVGNVCRSPTAERLLKRFHPSLTVASAGLGALVGKRRRSCGGERGERPRSVFGKITAQGKFRASVPGI